MDLELPVTLVVKAPNQKVDDQTIVCALGWTIKKLKEHISKVYPSKPREHQQKLIYSGRLLNDHLMLKDVLRQYDEEITTHTMHLVCAPSLTEQAQQGTQDSVVNSSSSSSSSSSREGSPMAAPTSTWAEGVLQRGGASEAGRSGQLGGAQPGPASFHNLYGTNMMYGASFYPGTMAYSPEQLMWLQQMYAQQMSQYMQLYQGVVPTANPQRPTAPQEAPAGPPPRRDAGEQPVRMNAQGGVVVDDDEDVNRDWLDWTYTLSRVAVLLSIVYFYSTFGRFVLVLSLFIMAYLYELYQGGWFRIQRRVNRANGAAEPAPQQPAADAQPAQADPPVEGQQPDQVPDEDASRADEPPEPGLPPRPSRLVVAWSFIYTFFSSLIPQQPPAINAN